MTLSVNRIYYNSSGQQIRIDLLIMTPKEISSSFSLDRDKDISVIYKRDISTQILDVHSDMIVDSISLIGNFNSRDTTNADWCQWELKLDTITSGTRDTKSVRCNMSDLPDVGDSVI